MHLQHWQWQQFVSFESCLIHLFLKYSQFLSIITHLDNLRFSNFFYTHFTVQLEINFIQIIFIVFLLIWEFLRGIIKSWGYRSMILIFFRCSIKKNVDSSERAEANKRIIKIDDTAFLFKKKNMVFIPRLWYNFFFGVKILKNKITRISLFLNFSFICFYCFLFYSG